MSKYIEDLKNNNTYLGIEFGSTRIKAVLIGQSNEPIAESSFDWENELVNGWWSYSLDTVKTGLQECFADLKKCVREKYDINLKRVGAIGISAMMHGYIALDENDNILVPFRSWRNTRSAKAADELTELFRFNVPARWSISHLQNAINNGESHVGKIKYLTTLSGYVHYMLTGKKVLGIDDASGMFPIDSKTRDFNDEMIKKFDEKNALPYSLRDILPTVLVAGEKAGCLTEKGRDFLDPTGEFETGVEFCAPEGDAGTGMVATNSVRESTGNVSAGTSIFAMVVLEKKMQTYHREIDVVSTPSGSDVAMVHCNTCTSDLDAWVSLTGEILKDNNVNLKKSELYDYFYKKALEGDNDCNGITTYNFYAGEPVIHVDEGVPTMRRQPQKPFTFSNLARSLVYSTLATLSLGMEILEKEDIKIKLITCHGGLFKSGEVTQPIASSALNCTTATFKSAGEGGPWGMALLAKYMKCKKDAQSLEDFLDSEVFGNSVVTRYEPNEKIRQGFKAYLEEYKKGLARI